jgi:hypothetical protein
MNIGLRDRIKFAVIFFGSLRVNTEAIEVTVCRTEDDGYQMDVNTTVLDSGFDDRMYG